MKKIILILLSGLLVVGSFVAASGQTDEMIFKSPVSNALSGRVDGVDFITNLNFNDVPAGHWSKEAIIRSGALDMVKGYDNNFNLNGLVTYQELIAFIVRAVGLEKEAILAAETVELPAGSSLLNHWARGYLIVANQRGILTAEEFNDALT